MKNKLQGMFVLSPTEIQTKNISAQNYPTQPEEEFIYYIHSGSKMKTKINLVLIMMLLISFQTMFAQNMEVSNGLVPTLKQERTNERIESGADLITAGCAYSATTQSILSASGPCAFDFLAFWSTSDYLSSMCQGGDGKYYVTGTNSPSLYQLDTVNISFVLLGNITGMGADVPNGISYNPVNGNYYIASSSNLFSFNVNTRVATLIGPFNTGGIMIDLCFDSNGTCYAYDIATDAGYTINISTGNANLLGPIGYDANYGQGMSYDFDTQTIYLTAFNNGTFTGQCRTMDPVTGNTTLLYDWGLEQIDAFALETILSPPCPVGAPSNPSPPNGATGLPITGNTATWTNGTGTTNVEVWFGPQGNVVKVYDGSAVNQYVLPALNYSTTYAWYIVCKDAVCGTQGPTWSFTTMQDPNPYYFCDEFNDMSNWNIIGPSGLANWSISYLGLAGGFPPELQMSWTPSFNGESKIRSNPFPLYSNQCCYFSFNFYFDWYADPSGTVTVGITYDGGVTSSPIYSVTNPTGNVGPIYVQTNFGTTSNLNQYAQIEITYSGNSFNTDNIYWDNVCVDYLLSDMCPPGAPGTLTAQVIFDPNTQVQLGWLDNTWNEAGFNVLRKNGEPNDPGDYVLVGTVGQNQTQYIDATVMPESTYTYRVFAYNQYGQNGSNTATIAVPVPVELSLFKAESENGEVHLSWITSTETNNQGFEVERMSSGSNFEKVGFVAGFGTTTEPKLYSFKDIDVVNGLYKYRLKQIDFDGTSSYSDEVNIEVEIPLVYALEQNYPNPFNPSTTIKYQIPNNGFVTLRIFDVLGNEVATLVNEEKPSGSYKVTFDGSNLTSGVYFYKLDIGSFNSIKKMILMK